MLRSLPSLLLSLTFTFAGSLPGIAQQATDAIPPEMTTDLAAPIDDPALRAAQEAKRSGAPVRAEHWMIAAAHPMAVAAGADVLRAGGTAADAMVAAQAMLGLVEPQSSGLGGGGFLVYFDAESGMLTTLDGPRPDGRGAPKMGTLGLARPAGPRHHRRRSGVSRLGAACGHDRL